MPGVPGAGKRFVGHPFIRIGTHNAGIFITFDRASTKQTKRSQAILNRTHRPALPSTIYNYCTQGLRGHGTCERHLGHASAGKTISLPLLFRSFKLSINFPSNIRRGSRHNLGTSRKSQALAPSPRARSHCCSLYAPSKW